MATLRERLEKAREVWLDGLDGRAYKFRIPTAYAMAHLDEVHRHEGRPKAGPIDWLRGGLVGVRGVKEIDMVPGGEAVDVAFDAEGIMLWLEDRPAELSLLAERVIDAINARFAARDALEKK